MKSKRNLKKTKRTTTKKRINNKNTNKTHTESSLKILPIGYSLYASKEYKGNSILEYNKEQEKKYHDKCLMTNSSWFGSLEVAKSYKTKNTSIYRWKAKKQTKLLNINKKNETFIKNIFEKCKINLVPTIVLDENIVKTINYAHPYLHMDNNERSLHEFNFCFGYLTVEEQNEFMKLLTFLLKNKIIKIETREGSSILKKINIKIAYYNVKSLLGKKEKYNRLSFYDFDKHAIMNLCKIVNNKRYNIAGVYQKNDTSFWFPDFIVYKMDIEEYILFDPQDNLVYDTKIE